MALRFSVYTSNEISFLLRLKFHGLASPRKPCKWLVCNKQRIRKDLLPIVSWYMTLLVLNDNELICTRNRNQNTIYYRTVINDLPCSEWQKLSETELEQYVIVTCMIHDYATAENSGMIGLYVLENFSPAKGTCSQVSWFTMVQPLKSCKVPGVYMYSYGGVCLYFLL